MSENIINLSGSIIYEFNKAYTGNIVITNPVYKTIYDRACLRCNCASLDLSKSSIQYINDEAFFFCYKLTTLILPDSLITIRRNTFAISPISSVHFGPNLRYFDGYSFNQCPNLNTFSIDENNEYYTVVS